MAHFSGGNSGGWEINFIRTIMDTEAPLECLSADLRAVVRNDRVVANSVVTVTQPGTYRTCLHLGNAGASPSPNKR